MRSILLSAVTVLLTLYSFGITQFCSPAATVHSCMFGNREAYIGEEKVSVSLKNEKKKRGFDPYLIAGFRGGLPPLCRNPFDC